MAGWRLGAAPRACWRGATGEVSRQSRGACGASRALRARIQRTLERRGGRDAVRVTVAGTEGSPHLCGGYSFDRLNRQNERAELRS